MLKYFVFALLVIVLIASGSYVVRYMNEDTENPIASTDRRMEIRSESVRYFDGVQGHYAEPAGAGSYPGVVMIHEWWGLNEHIKAQADELATHGYRVLAVDLFGRVATTPDEARVQVSSLDQAEALENLKAAEKFLRDRGAAKIASLGWCFGGGQSLQLATAAGEDLDATIVYYGNLPAEERLRNIQWPVLGIFGDQDQSISTSSVAQFKSSLDRLNIENEIHVYPGVGHAFANPSNAGFAPQETADAWAKTLAFLEKNLK